MAKTIKFNLILDECPVRNLEGLQEHFSIEDLLKYYKNGLLLRWLRVRGYKKQYDAVKMIKEESDITDVITELIKIFEMEVDCRNIEQELKILRYQEREKELLTEYKKNGFEKKQIIDDYHSGYLELIGDMIENKENMALLKAHSIQLEKEYINLFIIDRVALYFRLAEVAPKAIFAILTRDTLRYWWIGETADPKVYGHIKANLLSPIQLEVLGDDLKTINKDTQAMWDPIERPEIEVMVLHIEKGTFVKNAGSFSEKLGAEDINEKLIKLKGLEYQCNSVAHKLIYMEV